VSASEINYVDDFERGYTRRRKGGYWQYFTLTGKRVKARATIDRLNALALPPAYEDAWFCRDPKGHLQAFGTDARGRRQYRYHEGFRAARDAEKFSRSVEFAKTLPKIRKQVERDLARRDLSRERVVAAVVRLLDLGKVRIGNAAYAKANKSFGATTLRNRHAKVRGAKVMLEYVGKSGKAQQIGIEDRKLATLVKRCIDLPGQTLFQYLDESGERRAVSSGDVNDYLRNIAGDFTAKDFRTWGASVIAWRAVSAANGELSLKDLLTEVSDQLGNTPAIARKSYVHPAIIEAVSDRKALRKRDWQNPPPRRYLGSDERALMSFLSSAKSRVSGGRMNQP
jgi:DNA topoisomerase I